MEGSDVKGSFATNTTTGYTVDQGENNVTEKRKMLGH